MLTILCSIIIFFLLLIILADYTARAYVKYGDDKDSQEREYESLYKELQDDYLNKASYFDVQPKILSLQELKWKNKEKTNFLVMKFLERQFPPIEDRPTVKQQLKEINQYSRF
jgi:hypothetical protein